MSEYILWPFQGPALFIGIDTFKLNFSIKYNIDITFIIQDYNNISTHCRCLLWPKKPYTFDENFLAKAKIGN